MKKLLIIPAIFLTGSLLGCSVPHSESSHLNSIHTIGGHSCTSKLIENLPFSGDFKSAAGKMYEILSAEHKTESKNITLEGDSLVLNGAGVMSPASPGEKLSCQKQGDLYSCNLQNGSTCSSGMVEFSSHMNANSEARLASLFLSILEKHNSDLTVEREALPQVGDFSTLRVYYPTIISYLDQEKNTLITCSKMYLPTYAEKCKSAGRHSCLYEIKALDQKSARCTFERFL